MHKIIIILQQQLQVVLPSLAKKNICEFDFFIFYNNY